MSDGLDWMDGLSYTAVTPRASLQSDAKNLMEKAFVRKKRKRRKEERKNNNCKMWQYCRKQYLKKIKINR